LNAYVIPFEELTMRDVATVGGKNASLGEMIGQLSKLGVHVPGGFATTAQAFRDFLVQGGLAARIAKELSQQGEPTRLLDKAARLALQALAVDKVDILTGLILTPNALAVAPVATEAKKPMIIMNAATSIITTKSPYIVRVSMTLPQIAQPMAQWAAKNGVKKVYTVVADYGPGLDAESAFTKAFQAAGGEMVGSVHTPLQNPDFSPFVQRVKDAKPEAVFLFLPAGEQAIAFMKAYKERGLAEAGIKLFATGDITDDGVLDAMGDPTLGLVTSFHYSASHNSPENTAFKKAYADANGTALRPNFMAAAGYDGMAAIYEALKKTGGSTDGDKIMAALKGMKIASPRGAIMIDPETRDVVQTVYIRKVEKTGGGLYNTEFDKFPDQKDPGK